MKHNFDLGDTVEDVSAPKKTAGSKGNKSPSPSAKGTPKKDDHKVLKSTKVKKAAAKEPSSRVKRARVPTNFYLVQSSFDTSNERHRREPINLASDDDEDDDIEADLPQVAAKNKGSRRQAKKGHDDEESDDSENEEEDDEDEDEPVPKRQRVSRSNSVKALAPPAKTAKNDSKKGTKKQDTSAKKSATPAKKSATIVSVATQKPNDPKTVTSKPAKKDATDVLPSKPHVNSRPATSTTSSAGHNIATGLLETALNSNTKQNKILAAEVKAFTNAINSATMLISTLWEQYQEIQQKDMDLREAALKVAQAQMGVHEADKVTEDEVAQEQQDDVAEEKAAVAAVAVAMAVDDENESAKPNPVLL
ncbi:hypothetical protein DYB32_005938 [Aphanomyces invadans]|uniref:Uncharacterized protein n=1 Tax=Aphanomyces invadans TaxID=157072 RepID=A0A3R6WK69_9STRA|nr:hypothetical protein DYB32_005938 [Aphanomyces invadans]